MRRRIKPAWQKRIARERIAILFKQAHEQAKAGRLDRAHRYVFIARKIAMKYNVKIPRELKRKFCHHCYHYLYPGKNVKIRINRKTQAVEYICLDCGKITRYPYVREKHAKRN